MAVTLSVGLTLAEDDDGDDDDVCFKTTPSASSSKPRTIRLIGASISPVSSNRPVIGRIAGSPTRSVPSPSSEGSNGAAFSAQALPAGQAAGIGDNWETGHRPQCVARRRKKKFG